MAVDGADDIEKQREALERLIVKESATPKTWPKTDALDSLTNGGTTPPASTSFRFEGGTQTPEPVVDDVALGAKELVDVGQKVSGNLILLLDVCLGGLTSSVGLLFFGLFAVLYASGEFGSVSFIEQAPTASEGSYYTLQNPDELLMTEQAQAWARLRGGSCAAALRRASPQLPRARPALATLSSVAPRGGVPQMAANPPDAEARPADAALWAMAHQASPVTAAELDLDTALAEGSVAALEAAVARAEANRVAETYPQLRKARALLATIGGAAAPGSSDDDDDDAPSPPPPPPREEQPPSSLDAKMDAIFGAGFAPPPENVL